MSAFVKQSETMRASIEQNKLKIAELEKRILALQRQSANYVIGKSAMHDPRDANEDQIASLRQSIRNLETSIVNTERALPQTLELERVIDNINAQAEQEKREKAAADKKAHEKAVMDATLAAWLEVPGQDAVGFVAAWPSIAKQLATQNAVAVGAAEVEIKHQANPIKKFAEDFMKTKYGNVPGKRELTITATDRH